jgi:hypothetical protein
MAPEAPWSSDRAPKFNMTPLMILKKKHKLHPESETA